MPAQPILWNDASPLDRTVAVVDLVAYSTLARMLEENSGAAAVAELNRRIQELIQEALRPLDCALYSLIAKTGDGALIVFEDPGCAHEFAAGLHECAARHNAGRSEDSARRFFRIGLASGEITVTGHPDSPPEYAGVTIANAVRLQSAAKPGEVLIDLATFDKLPGATKALYSVEFLVRGKRDETFRVRKWKIEGVAPPEARKLSRRSMLALGLGATAAGAAAVWELGNPRLLYWMHPLPALRFVAFAAWPEPAHEVAAVTREMLSSVRQSLQRLESLDHRFLVVDTDEAAGSDLPAEKLSPLESAQKFGANLALLAASATNEGKLQLSLKVIDPKTQQVFRRTQLSGPLKDLSTFRENVLPAIAAMLDLPESPGGLEDDQEMARLPPRAYQLFAEGTTLGSDFNGPRRAEGIEKLQELVNTYPSFSVGYGELAGAYLEEFRTSRDPATLELARTNARQALKLNPDSALALLAIAKVEAAMGNPDAALSRLTKLLAKDPRNADALLYRASVYGEKGDAAGEMRAYQEILESRPNYWRAYNELGLAQEQRANYNKAVESFLMASHVAPHVSWPLFNLGGLYLQTGKQDQARDAYEKSIAIFPTADAYAGLGNIAFERGNYFLATDEFRRALKLAPRSHDLLRDLGDCQTMLGQTGAEKASFAKAAELLSEELKVNPIVGANWMLLSLYHAKIGDTIGAAADIARAEQQGANDVGSLLTKAQTLAVLGRHDEALALVLDCLHKGVSTADIDLAVDLRNIVKEPAYLKQVRISQT